MTDGNNGLVAVANSNIVMWQMPNSNIIKYFRKSSLKDESLLKSLSLQAGNLKFTLVEVEELREYLATLWAEERAGEDLDDYLCGLLFALSSGDVGSVNITNSMSLVFDGNAIKVQYSDKTEIELKDNLELNAKIVSLLKSAVATCPLSWLIHVQHNF